MVKAELSPVNEQAVFKRACPEASPAVDMERAYGSSRKRTVVILPVAGIGHRKALLAEYVDSVLFSTYPDDVARGGYAPDHIPREHLVSVPVD